MVIFGQEFQCKDMLLGDFCRRLLFNIVGIIPVLS